MRDKRLLTPLKNTRESRCAVRSGERESARDHDGERYMYQLERKGVDGWRRRRRGWRTNEKRNDMVEENVTTKIRAGTNTVNCV
jgi:hypothetical protein